MRNIKLVGKVASVAVLNELLANGWTLLAIVESEIRGAFPSFLVGHNDANAYYHANDEGYIDEGCEGMNAAILAAGGAGK
jgi:hypothetical protein